MTDLGLTDLNHPQRMRLMEDSASLFTISDVLRTDGVCASQASEIVRDFAERNVQMALACLGMKTEQLYEDCSLPYTYDDARRGWKKVLQEALKMLEGK